MIEGPEPSPEPSPESAPPGKVARARAGVAHAQTRGQDLLHQLEAKRPESKVVDASFHFYERDLGAGGGVLAGALAFRLFIYVVPYAFVLLTVFGSAADLTKESGQDAARSAGLTGLIAKSIADAQRQTDGTKIVSLLIGLFALYLAARAVVKTLRAVHALAWKVHLPRLQRSWRAAALLVGLTLATSAIATGASKLRTESFTLGLVVTFATFFVWAGAWLWVSRLLPHAPDTPWTAFVPGALLVGVVMQVMHVVTVLYFARKVSSASETYGAIGAAIGILLAMYLIGRMMSASAVLNATLWERKLVRDAASATEA